MTTVRMERMKRAGTLTRTETLTRKPFGTSFLEEAWTQVMLLSMIGSPQAIEWWILQNPPQTHRLSRIRGSGKSVTYQHPIYPPVIFYLVHNWWRASSVVGEKVGDGDWSWLNDLGNYCSCFPQRWDHYYVVYWLWDRLGWSSQENIGTICLLCSFPVDHPT